MSLSAQQKKIGLSACAAAVLAGAWLLFTNWSPDEAANAQHYQQAVLEVRGAIAYANERGGLIDPSDAAYLIGRYEAAMQQAAMVRDDVLAKLHADLPDTWHELFVPSTQIYIRALKSQDRDLARQASQLQDDWIRWLRLNGNKVDVPPPPSTEP